MIFVDIPQVKIYVLK